MNEKWKVSIVTVAYNSEMTIGRTIESVLNQTYCNLEYFIIDGESTDKTVAIAQGYSKYFSEKGIEYHIISEKDNGIYDAMNKGICMASGDLIGIINSDDWYEPRAVQCAVENYDKQKYDLFYADLRVVGEKGNFIKKSKDSNIVTSRHWNHPTTFITKDIYKKYQYKNENIHDDWDLILRLKKAGARVCVDNVVLANFSRNGVSHEKSIGKALKRARIKYKIYRDNDYSRWYAVECFGMELAKLVL